MKLYKGRTAIMALLGLKNWDSTCRIIEEQGLPVFKLGGRHAMYEDHYNLWRDKQASVDMNRIISSDKVQIEVSGDNLQIEVHGHVAS